MNDRTCHLVAKIIVEPSPAEFRLRADGNTLSSFSPTSVLCSLLDRRINRRVYNFRVTAAFHVFKNNWLDMHVRKGMV